MSFWKELKEDYRFYKERDPAIHSVWEVLLYPSFQVMRSYRKAHRHYLKGHYFRARLISQRAAKKTNIEIHPGAEIGKRFFIDHGTGVVIGETAIIGKNVTLYQGVTLGAKSFRYDEDGRPMSLPRHPILEDGVTVYSNASILGRVTIGEGSVIGAGSVVTRDIPPHSLAVGNPCRVVWEITEADRMKR